MKNHYIQATIEMLQSGTEAQTVFTGLTNTMHTKGHMRLYAPVLRGVLRIFETKKGASGSIVVVATDTDVQKHTDTIKQILTSIEAGADFSTKIDPTIVGGVIVKSDNTVVDCSYKTSLLNLYRAATRK